MVKLLFNIQIVLSRLRYKEKKKREKKKEKKNPLNPREGLQG